MEKIILNKSNLIKCNLNLLLTCKIKNKLTKYNLNSKTTLSNSNP